VAHSFAIIISATSRLIDGMGVAAAIVLSLLGTVLNHYLPRLQMSAEERAKDRKITNAEAHRRILFWRCCGVTVALLGVLALVLVMFDLMRD
jgi:divalent metal cation (Fe/Co/Zn/Cd) transporter